MTTAILIPHLSTPCPAIRAFSASLQRSAPDRLSLQFHIEGDVEQLLIPARTASRRQDGLWKHTCCEIFLKMGSTPAYYEFNFSPAGEWAAYRFDSYRSGMANADLDTPRIDVARASDRFDMDIGLNLPHDVIAADPQPVALSAVIEDRSTRISYWAVAHAPLKPDFHHDNGFVLDLSCSERSANEVWIDADRR